MCNRIAVATAFRIGALEFALLFRGDRGRIDFFEGGQGSVELCGFVQRRGLAEAIDDPILSGQGGHGREHQAEARARNQHVLVFHGRTVCVCPRRNISVAISA